MSARKRRMYCSFCETTLEEQAFSEAWLKSPSPERLAVEVNVKHVSTAEIDHADLDSRERAVLDMIRDGESMCDDCFAFFKARKAQERAR